MNRALWWKSIREGWWLLVSCGALLYLFAWINVWLISQVETQHLWRVLRFWRNPLLEQIIPVPLEVLVSPGGRVAAGFDHPLVIVPLCVWAIARGSDIVSGEIGRGTMEVLLAQPVRRIEVLISHAGVTIAGFFVLALLSWLGILTGMWMFPLEQKLPPRVFLPAESNLIALGLAIAGVTTLLSSCDRFRTRTIGLAVGVLLVEIVLALVAVSGPESWEWIRWTTFLSAYQPQVISHHFWPSVMAEYADFSWWLLIEYDLALVTLSAICYFAAGMIFCRRDLPAPL